MKRKKNIISKSETENESQIESSFYRIIFMGDSEVGKTQIINKYNKKIYQEEYLPTYSVNFQIKTIKNNGRILNIHCLDTEGSSDFSIDTGTLFIQKVDAFIYVFDITSRDSLYNLKDYNDIIKSALTDSEKVSYVVGNKCDLVMYRQVQENEARSEANIYKAKYMEVSAKTGINIDKLFDYVIQDIFKNKGKSSSIDSGGGILYKNIYNNNNQINNTNIFNQNVNQINTNINTNIKTNIITNNDTNIDTNTNANIITNIDDNSNTNISNNKKIQINNNLNNNIVTNIINPTNIDDNTENQNNINTNTNLIENEKSGLNYDNSSYYLKSNYNNNDNNNDLVKNINNIGINDNREEINNPNFFSNNNNNNYFKKCQIF